MSCGHVYFVFQSEMFHFVQTVWHQMPGLDDMDIGLSWPSDCQERYVLGEIAVTFVLHCVSKSCNTYVIVVHTWLSTLGTFLLLLSLQKSTSE